MQQDIPDDLKPKEDLCPDILGMLYPIQSLMTSLLQSLNSAIDALEDQDAKRNTAPDRGEHPHR